MLAVRRANVCARQALGPANEEGGLVGCTGLESSPPRTRLLALKPRLPSWPYWPGLGTLTAGPGHRHSSSHSVAYSPSSPAHQPLELASPGVPGSCPHPDGPHKGGTSSSQTAVTPLRSAVLDLPTCVPASVLTSFSTLYSRSTGSPGPPGEAVAGGGARDDPARASWRLPSGMAACGPRPPCPHSPAGLPASQAGFRGKPFASACREGLGLWSAVTFASASKLHPGPLPSAPASWQEDQTGEGTRVDRVRPGAGSIRPPAPLSEPRAETRQGGLFWGLQVPRAEAAGPLILPRRSASPGIHLRAGERCRLRVRGPCAFYCAAACGLFPQLPQNSALQGRYSRPQNGRGARLRFPRRRMGSPPGGKSAARFAGLCAPGTGGSSQRARTEQTACRRV